MRLNSFYTRPVLTVNTNASLAAGSIDCMCVCSCVCVWTEHVKLTVHLEHIKLNETQYTSHMCLLCNKHKEKRCANDTLRHSKASFTSDSSYDAHTFIQFVSVFFHRYAGQMTIRFLLFINCVFCFTTILLNDRTLFWLIFYAVIPKLCSLLWHRTPLQKHKLTNLSLNSIKTECTYFFSKILILKKHFERMEYSA